MTSKLKSETARINGAKSKGPKTPDGRAKSARNSIKHGLTAVNTIILDCESEDEFNELLANFMAMHQPVGAAEQDAVEQMALARWHVRRISTATTAVIDVEMARRKPETEKEFPGADPGIHMGLAVKALSDESRSLALFSRYKSREERTYERNYRTLRELQATRRAQQPSQPKAAPAPPAAEPEPTPKSPVKSSSSPVARAANSEFRDEPTVSSRRRFRVRQSPACSLSRQCRDRARHSRQQTC